MDRRSFLRSSLAGAGALAFGDAFWRAAQADPAVDADESPTYGALGPADLNGLQYPSGFKGRVIARSGTTVGLTSHVWPVFPDGAACFPREDGPGWILVANSENPPAADVGLLPEVQDLLGGASAIVFDGRGRIVDAYWVLRNTRSNCAGGVTPWGTWLSCEEFDYTTPGRLPGATPADAGRVFECSPTDKGGKQSRELPMLGRFKHEAAAFDDSGLVYLTEDMPDGCFYRFRPAGSANAPGSLVDGTLEALRMGAAGTVTWVGPIDPTAAAAPPRSTRVQATSLGATTFNGGEGCFHHEGTVLFTTKGDNRVWALKLGTGSAPDTIEVLYDGDADGEGEGRILNGVDNIIVSPETGNIYVAEDGDNMEVVVIETDASNPDHPTRTAAALIRATGPQHGLESSSPIPTASEITGLALSPDCTRLYFSGQRSFGLGITYEVKAPPGKLF